MTPATAIASEDAERSCAYLYEISPEMRGCAILTEGGELLASSATSSGASGEGWESAAIELIQAVDRAGSEPAAHAHVSTGDGEVFLVRAEGLIAIAVAEKLTLASLVLFDLRTALKDLAAGRGPR